MMTQRFIPLAVPNIGPAETASVLDAVSSGWVSTVGPAVTQFESQVAEVSGVGKAAAVASGTTALHMALIVLGVGRDDLVILPSYSFIASANAVSHAGAVPFFVDIDPDSWTLDPIAVRRAIENHFYRDVYNRLVHKASGQRLAAIMPVYTNGMPADMDAIRAVADDYDLPVLADAAASIGALYKGRPIGQVADLTALSFNGNKTLTTGGGGAVIGPDDAMVLRAKHISSTARIGTDYDHDEVGFNARMTNLEAALGVAQIERLPDFIAAKQRVADTYQTHLSDLPGVKMFPRPFWAERSVWFTGIVLGANAAMDVQGLVAALNADGIGVRKFWKPLHRQTPYLAVPRDALPVTEALWKHVLPLPCSTDLTDDDLEFIVARVVAHLGGPVA
jgi:perosamine synthetase